ncbi:MAG: hypothetical protein BAA03_05875 [Caldibacillus debilis]|nr:MAG: hypothetical protein BAA03_05875 [Caldibacillus debilis]
MPPDMSVPTARSSGGRFRERPSAERHSRLRKAVPDPLFLPPGTLPGGPKAVPFKGKQLRLAATGSVCRNRGGRGNGRFFPAVC